MELLRSTVPTREPYNNRYIARTSDRQQPTTQFCWRQGNSAIATSIRPQHPTRTCINELMTMSNYQKDTRIMPDRYSASCCLPLEDDNCPCYKNKADGDENDTASTTNSESSDTLDTFRTALTSKEPSNEQRVIRVIKEDEDDCIYHQTSLDTTGSIEDDDRNQHQASLYTTSISQDDDDCAHHQASLYTTRINSLHDENKRKEADIESYIISEAFSDDTDLDDVLGDKYSMGGSEDDENDCYGGEHLCCPGSRFPTECLSGACSGSSIRRNQRNERTDLKTRIFSRSIVPFHSWGDESDLDAWDTDVIPVGSPEAAHHEDLVNGKGRNIFLGMLVEYIQQSTQPVFPKHQSTIHQTVMSGASILLREILRVNVSPSSRSSLFMKALGSRKPKSYDDESTRNEESTVVTKVTTADYTTTNTTDEAVPFHITSKTRRSRISKAFGSRWKSLERENTANKSASTGKSVEDDKIQRDTGYDDAFLSLRTGSIDHRALVAKRMKSRRRVTEDEEKRLSTLFHEPQVTMQEFAMNNLDFISLIFTQLLFRVTSRQQLRLTYAYGPLVLQIQSIHFNCERVFIEILQLLLAIIERDSNPKEMVKEDTDLIIDEELREMINYASRETDISRLDFVDAHRDSISDDESDDGLSEEMARAGDVEDLDLLNADEVGPFSHPGFKPFMVTALFATDLSVHDYINAHYHHSITPFELEDDCMDEELTNLRWAEEELGRELAEVKFSDKRLTKETERKEMDEELLGELACMDEKLTNLSCAEEELNRELAEVKFSEERLTKEMECKEMDEELLGELAEVKLCEEPEAKEPTKNETEGRILPDNFEGSDREEAMEAVQQALLAMSSDSQSVEGSSSMEGSESTFDSGAAREAVHEALLRLQPILNGNIGSNLPMIQPGLMNKAAFWNHNLAMLSKKEQEEEFIVDLQHQPTASTLSPSAGSASLNCNHSEGFFPDTHDDAYPSLLSLTSVSTSNLNSHLPDGECMRRARDDSASSVANSYFPEAAPHYNNCLGCTNTFSPEMCGLFNGRQDISTSRLLLNQEQDPRSESKSKVNSVQVLPENAEPMVVVPASDNEEEDFEYFPQTGESCEEDASEFTISELQVGRLSPGASDIRAPSAGLCEKMAKEAWKRAVATNDSIESEKSRYLKISGPDPMFSSWMSMQDQSASVEENQMQHDVILASESVSDEKEDDCMYAESSSQSEQPSLNVTRSLNTLSGDLSEIGEYDVDPVWSMSPLINSFDSGSEQPLETNWSLDLTPLLDIDDSLSAAGHNSHSWSASTLKYSFPSFLSDKNEYYLSMSKTEGTESEEEERLRVEAKGRATDEPATSPAATDLGKRTIEHTGKICAKPNPCINRYDAESLGDSQSFHGLETVPFGKKTINLPCLSRQNSSNVDTKVENGCTNERHPTRLNISELITFFDSPKENLCSRYSVEKETLDCEADHVGPGVDGLFPKSGIKTSSDILSNEGDDGLNDALSEMSDVPDPNLLRNTSPENESLKSIKSRSIASDSRHSQEDTEKVDKHSHDDISEAESVIDSVTEQSEGPETRRDDYSSTHTGTSSSGAKDSSEDDRPRPKKDPSGEYSTGAYSRANSSGRDNENEVDTIYDLFSAQSEQEQIGTYESDNQQIYCQLSSSGSEMPQISMNDSSIELELNEVMLRSSTTELTKSYRSIEESADEEKPFDKPKHKYSPYLLAKPSKNEFEVGQDDKSRDKTESFIWQDHSLSRVQEIKAVAQELLCGEPKNGISWENDGLGSSSTLGCGLNFEAEADFDALYLSPETSVASPNSYECTSPVKGRMNFHDGGFRWLSDLSDSTDADTEGTDSSSWYSSIATSYSDDDDESDDESVYSAKPGIIVVAQQPPKARIGTTNDALDWSKPVKKKRSKTQESRSKTQESKKPQLSDFMCSFGQLDAMNERIWSYMGSASAPKREKDKISTKERKRILGVKHY